ncbi:hypothetical protein [uncultured Tateyamaria sp.]|uniref:hypothetical protein n=1 Tax=uncultured Tateyamaria sp. TaxID=455651 RepID=UPI00261C41AA|nr:hypothetical protein [uncultured Tateyamaria sp.]
MTGIQRTLLAIAAFVAIAVGTFVYFIANWDASKAEPIGMKSNETPFISPNKPRGLGQRPSPALSVRTTA